MPNKKLHDILRKGKTRQPRLAAEEVDESLLLELLDQPVKRGACGGSTLHEDLEMYSQICPKLPAKLESPSVGEGRSLNPETESGGRSTKME